MTKAECRRSASGTREVEQVRCAIVRLVYQWYGYGVSRGVEHRKGCAGATSTIDEARLCVCKRQGWLPTLLTRGSSRCNENASIRTLRASDGTRRGAAGLRTIALLYTKQAWIREGFALMMGSLETTGLSHKPRLLRTARPRLIKTHEEGSRRIEYLMR